MKLYVGVKALIEHEARVLILREAAYEEGTNTGKWDMPGGRINPEESMLEGLKREVMEESGLEIEPITALGAFDTFPTIKGEPCHIVRIYYLTRARNTDVKLSGDHDQYEWIDPKNYEKRQFVSDIEEMLAKVSIQS